MHIQSSKEARKIIGVDLDQTLAQTLESLVQWHNDTYSTKLKVSDFHTYDYWKVWGGTREETCMKLREFYDSPYFDQIQPVRDFALEALKMLKKRHFSLVIITSRQQFIAEKTKKFVDRHYSGIFDSIYFCNLGLSDAEQLDYVSKPKSAICQEVGVDVLIDDCLEHAVECSTLGIDILLYDKQGKYIWNHEDVFNKNHNCSNKRRKNTLTSTSKRLYQRTPTELSKNIHRVKTWREIIEQFPKPSSPLRYCFFKASSSSSSTSTTKTKPNSTVRKAVKRRKDATDAVPSNSNDEELIIDDSSGHPTSSDYGTLLHDDQDETGDEDVEESEKEEKDDQQDNDTPSSSHYPLWKDNRVWV
ncbi:hypothetical protein BDF20DRAFT_398638 [Mycotypha africana]|uniref:uncharacterized protein n=1 Tax=Mycotypha africana TaxID=64632 RepID=UPI0023012113|nr:uncharacterized protein BDF20DRAFT_398638 [Mycotypha africana]KAI8984604.1 hypothetical protein BDF20DRAFT_398638 [Mycotypha africana]